MRGKTLRLSANTLHLEKYNKAIVFFFKTSFGLDGLHNTYSRYTSRQTPCIIFVRRDTGLGRERKRRNRRPVRPLSRIIYGDSPRPWRWWYRWWWRWSWRKWRRRLQEQDQAQTPRGRISIHTQPKCIHPIGSAVLPDFRIPLTRGSRLVSVCQTSVVHVVLPNRRSSTLIRLSRKYTLPPRWC